MSVEAKPAIRLAWCLSQRQLSFVVLCLLIVPYTGALALECFGSQTLKPASIKLPLQS